MWIWKKKPPLEGFLKGFTVQFIREAGAMAVSKLPPAEIAKYSRERPQVAKELLWESYDKPFMPSTFVKEDSDGTFAVGWFTRDAKYECVKKFSNLADAITDYVLFSLCKGRWTPGE